MPQTPIIQRAFQLANDGLTPTDIRLKLREEGYAGLEISMHLHGQATKTALQRAAKSARGASPGWGLTRR